MEEKRDRVLKSRKSSPSPTHDAELLVPGRPDRASVLTAHVRMRGRNAFQRSTVWEVRSLTLPRSSSAAVL